MYTVYLRALFRGFAHIAGYAAACLRLRPFPLCFCRFLALPWSFRPPAGLRTRSSFENNFIALLTSLY